MANYKWPIYFFVAVAFWNMVGAGLFGFLINPPVALYYMQGLNLTPLHGHTALFGVYGMLGLGLTLFCLRAIRPGVQWKERPLKLAFWMINIGLTFMVVLSMLPIGILQALASIQQGTWYARSAEFLQTPSMQTPALDARSRRHPLRRRRRHPGPVRHRPPHRPLLRQERQTADARSHEEVLVAGD